MDPLSYRQELIRFAIASLPVVLDSAAWAWLISQEIVDASAALLDIGVGVAAVVLLRWRRKRPLTVALATAALSVASSAAIGAAFVALTSLATHRDWRRTASAGLVLFVSIVVAALVHSGFGVATQVAVVGSFVSIVAAGIAGLYIRSNRDLRASDFDYRQNEQRAALESARGSERARIAREMHDVLAHRLSLLTLHAGALAHRSDLSAAEIREAAAVIRDNAHASLDELRSTLGTLRDDILGPPQPSFADLPALLAEVREAGQNIDYSSAIIDAHLLPPQVGRQVYRIVQEGLTNSRKHAGGTLVAVNLRGSLSATVDIRIVNDVPRGRPDVTGGGLGLIGLSERALSVGGRLHYRQENGRFLVHATLPWPAAS